MSFILKYINNITKADIYNFGVKEGIKLEEYEVGIIYDYIKNEYIRILDNPEDVLCEAKIKLRNETYCKILELYQKYKKYLN